MPVTEWIPWAVRLANQKTACERCGTPGPRLGLHHRDEDRTNNSPENLLTLCPACHTRTHWENGKRAWKRLGSCGACERPARHLGWCNTHWSRVRRHGSPYLKKVKRGSEWLLVEDHGSANGPTLRESVSASPTASTDLEDSAMPSSPRSPSGSGEG
jgi:hypothetical protein